MNRSTILLITLLLVLGAITYFLLPSENERETSYKPALVSFSVDSASVVKIDIKAKAKSVSLENVGGKWTINSPIHYAADPNAVKQLVGGISKFKIGSLISSNPEKQTLFQVDSSGTLLTVTDRNGKTSQLIVGKMGPSFSEVYIRIPETKDVYLGEGIDSWTLNKEVKDWRDKTILATSSDAIKGLTYTMNSKETHFDRDSTGWKSPTKTLDAATMNPVLNSLSSLHADDFVDTLLKSAVRPIVLGIQGADNVTLNLYPSMPDSSKFFVQTSTSPQVFVISKWTAQQLLKPVEQPGTAKPVASAPPVETKPEKVSPPVTEKKTPSAMPPPPPKEEVAEAPEKKDTVAAVNPFAPKKSKAKRTRSSDQPPAESPAAPVTQTETAFPPSKPAETSPQSSAEGDEEGELTVHTVKKGETMTSIAEQYKVTVDKILKWNLLKSISVKPGQELYIYKK